MPQDDKAELRELFGDQFVEESLAEETPGEGESPAQSDSPSEKQTPSKEAAPAPQTEKQEEQEAGQDTEPDERYTELLNEVKRYKQYQPLLDILEEEPTLGRQILAGRLTKQLGIQPAAEPAPTVPAQPAAPSPEQVNEYWQKRIEEDPAGAVRDLIHVATQDATRGSKAASARVLVNDYKSRRRTEDPFFAQYEPYFDELARQANMDFIVNNPDATLGMIENIALGTFAREQRSKATRARTKPAPVRETPKSLEVSTKSTPTQPAKKRRELTDEERYLVSIYGEDALPDEDETSTHPWGR